jgi:hypothetical protein
MPETIVAKNVDRFTQFDIKGLVEGNMFRETPFRKSLNSINWTEYSDKRVLVKACAGMPIPPWAFMLVMAKLLPVVRSVAYGDDCAPVAVYKRK